MALHTRNDFGGNTGVLQDAINPQGFTDGTPDPTVIEPGTVNDPMSDDELLAICQDEMDSALGWTGTRLTEARRKNLSEYFGNFRGDEVEGRSQVVSRDIYEQVETVLPSIMEAFTSGDEVVRFLPEGPEDDAMCDQITDTVNYVFRTNKGDKALMTMFKDALIQKSGVVKVWWDENARSYPEEYDGKSLLELPGILEDPNLTITAITFWTEVNGERVELDPAQPELPVPPDQVYCDVRATRRQLKGRIRLTSIAPEDWGANRDARGMEEEDGLRYCYQRIRTTESEMISWGYDPELVKALPSSDAVYTTDIDLIVRSSQDDSQPLTNSYRRDSQRTIWLNEQYVLVDRDGDGISEWWKVFTAGEYGQALVSAEQVDGHPFAFITPVPVPHRLYGMSLSDTTSDLQNVKTSLRRMLLDSLYLGIHPRYSIFSKPTGNVPGASSQPMVNLSQLIRVVPGGYVERYAPDPATITPLPTMDSAQHALPGLEMLDEELKRRNGISYDALAVTPEMMNQTAYGVMVQQSASAQRITMYARVFSWGVKRIFQLIYELLMKHQSKPMMLRLRGQWTPSDPTQWRRGMDCEVSVALGQASRMEKAANAQTVGQVQKQLVEAGLGHMVHPDDVWNMLTALCEAMGYRHAEKFFTETGPENPPQPPPPDPAAQAVEAQTRIEMAKVEQDGVKTALEARKAEWQHEENLIKLHIEAAKNDVDLSGVVEQTEARVDSPLAPEVPQ